MSEVASITEFDESAARHGIDWQWYRDVQSWLIDRHGENYGNSTYLKSGYVELAVKGLFAGNDHTWHVPDPANLESVTERFQDHIIGATAENLHSFSSEGEDIWTEGTDYEGRAVMLGDERLVSDTILAFSGLWVAALKRGLAEPDLPLGQNYSASSEEGRDLPPLEIRIAELGKSFLAGLV